jgi:hypothetical protein
MTTEIKSEIAMLVKRQRVITIRLEKLEPVKAYTEPSEYAAVRDRLQSQHDDNQVQILRLQGQLDKEVTDATD